jgi:hypothetical protein
MKMLCWIFGHSRFEIPVVRLPALEVVGVPAWCRRCFRDLPEGVRD